MINLRVPARTEDTPPPRRAAADLCRRSRAARMRNPAWWPQVRADMTTIGLIGSGNIGSTVARLAVAAGYDVVLSNSRGPETLRDLVAELGPRARAGTPAQAATAGDIAVVTVPLKAYRDVPADALAGKVVIDTNNYYPERDGVIAELEDGSATTGELLQRHLADAHVVKGFNNIYFKHLATLSRPAGAADRTALPIAGDDAGAKRTVTGFLDRIGYDTVDVGPLAENWRTQRDTPVYVTPYGSFTDPVGTPADAGTVRKAVAAATPDAG
ncbi:NADPH-dependent F420 reductase [Actinoplanes sp. NPDC049668]